MLPINNIYCGDNRELIKQLDNDSVDTIITSPPYGKMITDYHTDYNFELLATEMYRVLKPGGWLLWNERDTSSQGRKNTKCHEHLFSFKNLGLNYFETIIVYNENRPTMHPNIYFKNEYEYIFCLYKGSKLPNINFIEYKNRRIGILVKETKKSKQNYYRHNHKTFTIKETSRDSNVWKYDNVSNVIRSNNKDVVNKGKMNLHICKKLVYTFSNPHDLILDPFNGIGTTCIVAKEMERNYIGFEINEQYVNFTKDYLLNVNPLPFNAILDKK